MEILVSKVTEVAKPNQAPVFLAIKAEEKEMWEERLRASTWSQFEFLQIDQAKVDAVKEWPEDALTLCAVAFGYGMYREANAPGAMWSVWVLEWLPRVGGIKVAPFERYLERRVELRNPHFHKLLTEIETHGEEVMQFPGC